MEEISLEEAIKQLKEEIAYYREDSKEIEPEQHYMADCWEIILKELEKKDRIINKAIEYMEVNKSSLGNYVLSPSEMELLFKILLLNKESI